MLHRRDAMLGLGTAAGGNACPGRSAEGGTLWGRGRGSSVAWSGAESSLLHLPVHVGGSTPAGHVGHEAGRPRWHPQPLRSDFDDGSRAVPGRTSAACGRRGGQAGDCPVAAAHMDRPPNVGASSAHGAFDGPTAHVSGEWSAAHRFSGDRIAVFASPRTVGFSGERRHPPTRRTRRRPLRRHGGRFFGGDPRIDRTGRGLQPCGDGAASERVAVGPAAGSPDDVSAARLRARRGLVRMLEDQDRAAQRGHAISAYGSAEEAAYRLIQASSVRDALRVELESDATRDRYGRNEYGESFLTARRLVEAGVRIVSVNWMFITPKAKVYNVWDTHGGLNDLEHGETGYGMLTAPYCLPALDRAFSALLADLSARGLLDETLVACVGEFGRTPKINGVNGRDHWPHCYSAVLAGGGVHGGAVYGASDKEAAYVKENPVTPGDYLATICRACGLDPSREIQDLEGRPLRAVDGEPIDALLG